MRPEKTAILSEIREKAERSAFLFLANYHGMTVEQSTAFKAALRPTGARMMVVKNRLLRIVCREKGWTALEPFLKQGTAMIVGSDPVETAKAVQKFRADPVNQKRPEPKAGVLGNQVLSAQDIERLATIPPRPVLYGQLVGALAAPMSGLVGVMSRTVGSLVQVLKAAADKKAAQAA